MGKEAVCACQWGGTTAEVKACLESGELILRGGIRRKIPFAAMQQVRAEGDRLAFAVENEAVSLALGGVQAEKWMRTIVLPPPTLAKKLGITAQTKVWLMSVADDPALAAALEEAGEVSKQSGDLILAHVGTPAGLATVLQRTSAQLREGVPIWVIYPKGPGQALGETAVRAMILPLGMVDTKVASVSPLLTAMRFIRRKG